MASRALAVLTVLLMASVPAFAQQSSPAAQGQTPAVEPGQQAQTPPPAAKPAAQAPKPAAQTPKPAEKPAEPQKEKPKDDQTPKFEEAVVVTASKVEQQLVNAPATVSVINAQTLASKSGNDYAGLFRAVAGVNVSQTSARDLNITSRGSTSTLSTSQLALIDGRSVYLDFFGFVGWDFLPLNFNEVKQIEVVRGPASAVWGANAMSGVVNIITKSPREMQGTTITFGAGMFDRTFDGQAADPGKGGSMYTSISHASVVNDKVSYKVSFGYVSQDAFARPEGTVPGSATATNPGGTTYPSFTNTGTSQPKADARVDYEMDNGKRMTFSGGYAGTSGIIHTGIGPFRIEKGTGNGYGRWDYSSGGMKIQFFTNILDGTAPALMSVDPAGNPITFTFKTQTYDFSFSDIKAAGTHHVFSYGANVRYNHFDLSIAPGGNARNEQGIYIQDEMFLSKNFRWLVGGRLDHFDVLSNPVFSPRTTFMIKPSEQQTFRISYNEAYRAPSLTNTYLEVTTLSPTVTLIAPTSTTPGRTFNFPMVSEGNPNLKETQLKAFEIGYTGTINNRVQVSFAWYMNKMKDDMYFSPDAYYSAAAPPPGWPLPPSYVPVNTLPSHYTYLNKGVLDTKGVEMGLDAAVAPGVTMFANYSWQGLPSPSGTDTLGRPFTMADVNQPPTNRFNAGVNFSKSRYLGDLNLSYQDKAYWKDVLNPLYIGWTDAFTTVNCSFGVKWAGGKVLTTLKVNDLFNQKIMQHIFGDVIKRAVVGEVRIGL